MVYFFHRYLFVFFLFTGTGVHAQTVIAQQLEAAVNELNNASKYEEAIKLVNDFIDDPKKDDYNRYYAYKYKAHTYKRLFNYPEVYSNLDLALQYGSATKHRDSVMASIEAEKAFALFDEQLFDEARKKMDALKSKGYAYLHDSDKAYIIMQEGYFLMKEKDYIQAENYYHQAENLLLKVTPRNTPVVYGKLIELFGITGDSVKQHDYFKKGVEAADEYGILKYKLYLYEIMAHHARINERFTYAALLQDSINNIATIYNAKLYNGRLSLLEKEMDRQKADLEKGYNYKLILFLVILSIVLLAFIFLLFKYNRVSVEKNRLLQAEYEKMNTELGRLTQEMHKKEGEPDKWEKYALSDRQKEILTLLQAGKSNKEIAAELFISENTVKFHIKTLYEKLNIARRTDIAKMHTK
jgi:DNA-binding CsgD family transcriptional regulator